MKLNLQQIKDITLGAVRVTCEEDGFHFYRFTSEQEALYKNRNTDFYNKSFSTSGVQLIFKTDSETLFMKVSVSMASSRRYFSFDVLVNGTKIDAIDNFSNVDLPQKYAGVSLPTGDFEKTILLGSGEKEVCIYLPWSMKATIKEFFLDDDAFIIPIKPSKKILCFGDSITQGYDALSPCNKYISRLAKALNAEEYNKAIGGEVFFPALAAAKDDFEPDYITVAYGTNDWNRCTEEDLRKNCEEFFVNLSANYPDCKIFVITPIWRKDLEEHRTFGKFEKVEEIIKSIAGRYQNAVVISGFDFVEHNEKFYADLRLHPNDAGFEQYFTNLIQRI